jgi:predicted transcriptional regulator
MKLRMPQEIEVWYLLPAIRRELARAMLKRGIKQREISKSLGITEPAVSQYMRSKRAGSVKFSSSMMDEIEKAAKRVIKGKDVMIEMQRICRMCRKDETLCRIHRTHGKVPVGCRICFER